MAPNAKKARKATTPTITPIIRLRCASFPWGCEVKLWFVVVWLVIKTENSDKVYGWAPIIESMVMLCSPSRKYGDSKSICGDVVRLSAENNFEMGSPISIV